MGVSHLLKDKRAQELNPTVFVVRNAEFLEDDLITEEGSGSLEDLEIIQNKIRILLKTLAYIMMRVIKKLMNLKVISFSFVGPQGHDMLLIECV
ncbi:hypothetical protein Tco_0477050, partial [Tanacetum coccineum]